ncbi:unnamed protein product [marine sediment metagenome]|uniref:Uncharacterized protein n=1 Tax=marine sediment metagenome TaxID=412755 RepID=X1BD16_9ZZZZ
MPEMTLTEAIEMVEGELAKLQPGDIAYWKDAVELLIEAGKKIELLRSKSHNYRIPLLPGETPE